MKKVGIIPENRGNSNFCFLCGSVYGDNAAAANPRSAGMANPIVQSKAIVQIISCLLSGANFSAKKNESSPSGWEGFWYGMGRPGSSLIRFGFFDGTEPDALQ